MGDGPTRRAPKPFARWSADTERAFLLALKYTGQATKACAEIGRGTSAAYHRRQRDPDFARAWDEAVVAGQAEWAALSAERQGAIDDGAGGGRWSRARERADGWDVRRRGTFLIVLQQTKNVREACRAAGMSSTAAYTLRERSPEFEAAWEKALSEPTVLATALDRAVNGWVEPIVAGGKVIGERRRYSDSLLRALLLREGAVAKAAARATAGAAEKLPKSKKALEARAKEVAKAAGGYFSEAFASREETDAALMKQLAGVERRRKREAAEAQAREWARWRDCWGGFGAAAPGSLPADARADVAGVKLLTYAPGKAGE